MLRVRGIILVVLFIFTFNSSIAVATNNNVQETPDNQELQRIASKLFTYIDVTKPEMAKVAALYNERDYNGALEAYRDRFFKVLNESDLKIPITALGTSKSADDLLKNNFIVKSAWRSDYGKLELGIPGTSNFTWFVHPDNDDVDTMTHMTTLGWLATLPTEYVKTKDPIYLKKWMELMSEWSLKHYEQYKIAVKDTFYAALGVAYSNPLYGQDRARVIIGQLKQFATIEDLTNETFSGYVLGNILNYLFEHTVPYLYAPCIPNQEIAAAKVLAILGVIIPDAMDSEKYIEDSLAKIMTYISVAGYLPDGGDVEQNLMYSSSFSNDTNAIIKIVEKSKFSKSKTVKIAKEKVQARLRYMASLVSPLKNYPHSDTTYMDTQMFNMSTILSIEPEDPVLQSISDKLIKELDVEAPAFESVNYPYSGWVAFRDGWNPDSNYLFMKYSRSGKGHYAEEGNAVQIYAYGERLVGAGGPGKYLEDQYNDFFHSSNSKSTVLVDGYSQVLGKSKPMPSTSYDSLIPARFSTTENFDFIEGNYSDVYGLTTGGTLSKYQAKITGVSHARQVIFLRDIGSYIITDKMASDATHTYTQNWVYNKYFSTNDVFPNTQNNTIKTANAFNPNINMYHFPQTPLTYKLYYGEDEPEQMGWYQDSSHDTNSVIPTVDIGASWTGTGNQTLVTLTTPLKDNIEKVASTQQVKDEENTYNGFDCKLKDGTEINYRVAINNIAKMTVGDIQAEGEAILVIVLPNGQTKGILLKNKKISLRNVDKKSVVKKSNAEFEIVNGEFANIKQIQIPTKFEWVKTPKGLAPEYND